MSTSKVRFASAPEWAALVVLACACVISAAFEASRWILFFQALIFGGLLGRQWANYQNKSERRYADPRLVELERSHDARSDLDS